MLMADDDRYRDSVNFMFFGGIFLYFGGHFYTAQERQVVIIQSQVQVLLHTY